MEKNIANCNCCGMPFYKRKEKHVSCSKRCSSQVYRESIKNGSRQTIKEKIVSIIGQEGYVQWKRNCLELFNYKMKERKELKESCFVEEEKQAKVKYKPSKHHPWRNSSFCRAFRTSDDYEVNLD